MLSLNTAQDANAKVYLTYCSCPDASIAEEIARTLVNEGLAACVHCLPSGLSIYRWQGQIEQTRECTLLIKAPAVNYPALEARIRALHPYELPEVIAVPLSAGLPEYLDWIRESAKA